MNLPEKISRFKYAIILALIVFLGAFLRVYKIDNQSLWIDEGFTIMQEKAIFEHGYPLLMSGNTEYKDSLQPYILAFVSIFTGESILAFRFVSALFGIASIIAIYFLGKNYFNKNVGLMSAFFISFSYWHIAWSRQIRSYSLFIFLLLLVLLFFFYYQKNGGRKWLTLFLLTLLFLILAKLSFGIIVSIPILLYLLFQKNKIHYAAISLSIFFIIILSILNHNFLFRIISLAKTNYLKYYTIEYFWNCFGLVFALSIAGAIFYYHENKNKLQKYHLINFTIFLFSLIFFSFFSLINQKRYLFFLTPFLFIYASYCIYLISEKRKLLMLSLLSLVVLIDQVSVQSFHFKNSSEYYLEQYTPQPDFKNAYSEILKTNNDAVIISAYPFMDYIYTGKAGFALPISYSGLPNDPSLSYSSEYYTNAQRLLSVEELSSMANTPNVMIILDDMAISRSDKNMIKFIQENGYPIYENKNKIGQKIIVYKLK